MDFYNAPSIEQISFKLTENFIPSATQLPYPPPSCDSLEYTLSRVSIQYILCQNQEPNIPQPAAEQSCAQKESTLKTTCQDLTAVTPFKKNGKASFRQRFVSSSKATDKPKIQRRLSLHLMSLERPKLEKKECLAPLRCPNTAPLRVKQQRKKSGSGKQTLNTKKLVEWELPELQNSMKVRGLVLESHQAREKSFIRKVIQNRNNVMHPIQQISQGSQVWTSRRSFRIH